MNSDIVWKLIKWFVPLYIASYSLIGILGKVTDTDISGINLGAGIVLAIIYIFSTFFILIKLTKLGINRQDNLKEIIAFIILIFVILPIILISLYDYNASTPGGSEVAIHFSIVIFTLALIALFVSMILTGFKRQKTKTKITGFIGLGIMALIGIIIATNTTLRNHYEDKAREESAKEIVEAASPIYAPDLSYIETDYKTKKPRLNGVLYKIDAYDFKLNSIPSSPGFPDYELKLRGFPNKTSNKGHFDPDNNICNLEWFFPKDDEVNTGYRCIKVGKLKNGSAIYTNEYSQRNDTDWPHEVYFGTLYQDKIITVEIDKFWMANSSRSINDPANDRVRYIINILDSMSVYQKIEVEKIFEINPSAGVTK
jgi:hypothetical protein